MSGCIHPNKVIEYDEEVKLHDGSMIWVHIKRHYSWSGWAPAMSGAYQAGVVEVSWDTGFPNVGRKSVFFYDGLFLVDKIDGIWYVAGQKNLPFKLSKHNIFALLVKNTNLIKSQEM
ncbi:MULTISPECIES: hypothetical protein [unclassified Acinetobacter]|uniref:hypothetical protein n=1 Tax=unclassified Acinetobacter TaxID=196816 RepID=UPI0035B976E1